MPAGFRRHLVGKTLRNVCYSVVTEIPFIQTVYWILAASKGWIKAFDGRLMTMCTFLKLTD